MYDYVDLHYMIYKAEDDHNQQESLNDDYLVE